MTEPRRRFSEYTLEPGNADTGNIERLVTGDFVGALPFSPPYPNATASTVGAKLDQFVSIADFATADMDAAHDHTEAFDRAISYLSSLNGGSIILPNKTWYLANVELPTGIGFFSPGPMQGYYFGSTYNGSVLRLADNSPTSAVVGVLVTIGGSDYASAPTVSFVGGGGSGAAATAYVSGGQVVFIEMTDPGVGYSSAPTIVLSGGSGSGAAATAFVSSTLFYTTGAPKRSISFQNVTFVGRDTLGGQDVSNGLVLHDVSLVDFINCSSYYFMDAAVRQMAGGQLYMNGGRWFGCDDRTSRSFRTGAIHLAGNDNTLVGMECGAEPSSDEANLWNAAVQIDGTALMAFGIVAEGADVGFRITGGNNQFAACRADINYGHGWHLMRENAVASPPRATRLSNCWGHRNGRYATNTFDNFHIRTGDAISDCQFDLIRSSYSAADGWTHRYGFNDGSTTGTSLVNFKDVGAGTSWYHNSGGSVLMGPQASAVDGVSGPTWAAASVSVEKMEMIRPVVASPLTITTITGGFNGQTIYIQPTNGNLTVGNSGTGQGKITTNTGADKALSAFGVYVFRNILGAWFEITP